MVLTPEGTVTLVSVPSYLYNVSSLTDKVPLSAFDDNTDEAKTMTAIRQRVMAEIVIILMLFFIDYPLTTIWLLQLFFYLS